VLFSFVCLRNFRNYRHLELEIPRGASLFIGLNAQGKTNLLEACYYISSLNSPRSERESDLVYWGEESFLLAARLDNQEEATTVKIETVAMPSVRRKIQINDRYARRQDLLTLFPCVYFSPDDLYMIKGSSALRRKFIDSILSRQDPVYARELSRYQDTVSRRNMALKKAAFDVSWSRALESLDELLVNWGSRVLQKRLLLIEKLSGFAKATYNYISTGDCDISYTSTIGNIQPGLEDIKAQFMAKLDKVRKEERLRGITLIGPHRDEMVVSFEGKTFRYFGSQGQQRSMVLTLKMAEARALEATFKTKPVLLLDDVLSELDSEKRSKVLSLCDFGYQVLMTSTHLPEDNESRFSVFEVKEGGVRPIRD
jgi:DNA replication and repair protein RecF